MYVTAPVASRLTFVDPAGTAIDRLGPGRFLLGGSGTTRVPDPAGTTFPAGESTGVPAGNATVPGADVRVGAPAGAYGGEALGGVTCVPAPESTGEGVGIAAADAGCCEGSHDTGAERDGSGDGLPPPPPPDPSPYPDVVSGCVDGAAAAAVVEAVVADAAAFFR